MTREELITELTEQGADYISLGEDTICIEGHFNWKQLQKIATLYKAFYFEGGYPEDDSETKALR